MKPKDTTLNYYEITRLEKTNCDKVRKKILENKERYTQDELSVIQRMNFYNMLNENELKHICAIFCSMAISGKLK